MVPDHPLHQLKPKSGVRVGTGLPPGNLTISLHKAGFGTVARAA
jgi:hypothetical protein